MSWICNVLGCGGDQCVHRITDSCCPYCGNFMVEVTTTGHRFCAETISGACDYETQETAMETDSQTPHKCDDCRDTGERVIFDDRFSEGYAIVFCCCINGQMLTATQSDDISNHGS